MNDFVITVASTLTPAAICYVAFKLEKVTHEIHSLSSRVANLERMLGEGFPPVGGRFSFPGSTQIRSRDRQGPGASLGGDRGPAAGNDPVGPSDC
jgi:hypothetical protein